MISEQAVRDYEQAELADEKTQLELETYAREKMRLGEAWVCEDVDFCFEELWVGFALKETLTKTLKTHLNFYADRADFEAWRGRTLPAYLDGWLGTQEPMWESLNPCPPRSGGPYLRDLV